jgi:hypothetical protein
MLRNGKVLPFEEPGGGVAVQVSGTVKFAGVGVPMKTVVFPPRGATSGIWKV